MRTTVSRRLGVLLGMGLAAPALGLTASGLVILGLAGPAWGQGQTFTIPLVSDFEAADYGVFFADVAGRLEGRLEDGRLVVAREVAPGQGRLAAYVLSAETPVSVFVDVSIDLDAPVGADDLAVGAGVVIARSGSSFYTLLLQNEGYVVSAWANGAVAQQLSGSLPEGSQGTVRLAAQQTGDGAAFFVDGTRVGALSDSRVTGREAGLAVFGGGTFVFDNFGINSISDIGD